MKKIILLLAILVHALTSFAQRGQRTAELFLEIPDRGKFVVYLNDEYVGSSGGKFRFFEISDPNPVLSIFQDNRQLFKQRIRMEPNQRAIGCFSQRRGFQLTETLSIFSRDRYTLDDWNGGTIGYQDRNYAMSPEDFDQLMASVKRESFDNGKIKIIEIALKNNLFSTKQVGELIRCITFEDAALEIAKKAYPVTVDQNNYYTLKSSFKFLSGQDNFIDFLNKIPPKR